MRDPARIDRILNMLKAHWMSYPDQRLGQLLDNAIYDRRMNMGVSPDFDLFNLEDDEVENALKRYLDAKSRKPV